MKKLITILLLFIALKTSAQTKDTTQPRLLYLVMPEMKWKELLDIIKSADEKPSLLKLWEQMLLSSLREVPKPEVKEQPKPKK